MPTRDSLRRALGLGHWNGVLWAAGNALTSGSLVTYLSLDLGAQAGELSWLLASQALAGMLRFAAPALITSFGSARRACLWLTLSSYALIALLPVATVVDSPLRYLPHVQTIIVLLCVHQALEALGTVALWDWWSRIVPARVRGRYFSRRNVWQLLAIIPLAWASGYFVDTWRERYPEAMVWAYGLVTAVGVLLLLASLVPLWFMPEATAYAERRRQELAPAERGNIWRALTSSVFWPLLAFGCTCSLVNGLTQAAQGVYPKEVLKVSLAQQTLFVALMRFGQMGYSIWFGSFSDRFGLRPGLIASQVAQAAGLLFFVLSRPGDTVWLYGAWLAWSAFAGINIGVPVLMLKLAPRGQAAAWFGVYHGLAGVCYASATIAGGKIVDALRDRFGVEPCGPLPLTFFGYLFLAGWIARTMTAGWLALVREPEAWTWRQIVRTYDSRSGPRDISLKGQNVDESA
ncbi:MAG: MFS transporter [Planctomycetes bacterium]|nr:MFS transporter [Planctomycetota bacterium]